MNALPASSSKDDVFLERKLRYEFAKLNAKGQLHSMYRTGYTKPVCWSNLDCADSRMSLGFGGRAVHPTPIVGKRIEMQVEPQRDPQKCQWRTGNLAK